MTYKCKKNCLLLDWLVEQFPESSKRTLRQWIENGRIAVNGREVKKSNTSLHENDRIVIRNRGEKSSIGLKILYEDPHLVVIDKPAGLLSVATPKEKKLTAHAILKKRNPGRKVTPVHRLDKETSGILVFAYTETAKEGLKEQFFHHTVKRHYIAIVEGVLKEKGKWVCDLEEDSSLYVRCVAEGMGKKAITHFQRLKENKGRSLVRIRLETGRKNQIRAQALHFGHPLLGDKKYGGKPAKRLALHAATLTFVHPLSGKEMSFSSPLPEGFPNL